MPSSPPGRLPNETWEAIFCKLPGHDLSKYVQFVCRTFYSIIKNSLEFQYSIALACEGMVDTSTSDLPFLNRLAVLHKRRAGWDSLGWELLPEVTSLDNFRLSGFAGGFFVTLSGDRNLSSVQLPSKNNPKPNICSVQLAREMYAQDFVLDPTQDVIIFFTQDRNGIFLFGREQRQYTLYVRSLSSARPHPDARYSRLFTPCDLSRGYLTVLRIHGDLVGFLRVDDPTSELHIWDWQTGEHLVNQEFESNLPMGFAFLDSEFFVVIFRGGQSSSGCLKIFELMSRAPITTLLFPKVTQPDSKAQPGFRLKHAAIQTPDVLADNLPDRIFTSAPGVRVHTIPLYYERASEAYRFFLFVLNDTLLHFANLSSKYGSTVPWEEWGPQNTRMIEVNKVLEWPNTRVILPSRLEVGELELLDFNYRRPLDPRSEATSGVQRHDQPTTISIPGLFEKDVVTTLPYFKWTKKLPEEFGSRDIAYMIDEDRIIGLMKTGTGYTLYTWAL